MEQRPTPEQFRIYILDSMVSDDPRPPVVIFDRDGTLASVAWVVPQDRDSESWARYNAALPFDAVVPYVASLLRAVPEGVGRFMFSGRAAGDKPGQDFRYWQMRAWIAKHDLPIDRLYQRVAGDQRKDSIVKNEFLAKVSETHRVILAVDDREQVCSETWDANGIPLVRVVDPRIDPMILG